MNEKTTRRRALKNASAAFGFTFLPSYLATGVRAQGDPQPPSKRINLGCVGAGGRAGGVIPGICKGGHAKVVAATDVDFGGRSKKEGGYLEGARLYADFRAMMDKSGKDIDAVSVVTPDHSHFCPTILAMSMGKHVYVEKPLTHTFEESQMLMDAEKKWGVVTQMGNQGHTGSGVHQFKTWAENGILDNVRHIDAYKKPGLWFMKANERIDAYPTNETAPETLDWNLWCGPKEVKPYSRLLHPFNWRAWYMYGNGMLGDWGAHIIDYAHHHLKLGLPTKIEALRMDDHNDVIFPLTSHLKMTFPKRSETMPECTLTWRDGADIHPEVPEKFWDNGKPPKLDGAGTLIMPEGKDYAISRGSHGNSSRIFPVPAREALGDTWKTESIKIGHQESFTQACMGNGETWSPFSVAGELTQVLLLGVISQRFNQSFEFDPKTKQFTGSNAEIGNAYLKGPSPVRKGWEQFYKMV